MSKQVWKIIEIKVRKIGVAKTKEREKETRESHVIEIKKDMELCDQDKERVCTKEEEGISIIKREEERGI